MTAMRATDIVRHRRERARAAQSRGRRLGRAVAGIGLGAALVCCLALLPVVLAVSAALLNLTGGLPDIRRLEQLPLHAQASTGVTRLVALDVPAADGTRAPVLIDTINDPRATGTGWVHTAQLPPHVVTAHLAVIDPDFLSAAPPPLLDELRTWGQTGYTPAPPSSITTQLIDAHLWQDDGPGQARRAQQDWILARQIGLRYTKEQQLEWWLNTQYYGNLAYGIETAARVYFGKGATELTLGEAALLAAAAEDPTANPFDDLQAARRGQATSLSRMVTAGAITADEAAVAGAELPTLAPPPGSGSAAPDFARLARRELEAILGAERLLAGGLQVETTLDLALQKQAICVTAAARGEVPGSAGAPACPALAFAGPSSMGPDGEARTAEVIAINPASGELLALTGEPAAHSLGTLVQPFIYLTALSQGYSAATLTMDTPAIYLQDGRPYGPRNADGQYWGPLRLRQALASGRTVPATQVLSWVGGDRVRATARALGLSPDNEAVTADLAFPERGFPATLREVGGAFASIGNGGITTGVALAGDVPHPTTIRRVRDAAGLEVYTYAPATRDALSPELAYLLTDILSDTETRCKTGDCLETVALDGRRAATVTGTAEDGAWVVGYTPALLVGVWTETSATASATWRGLMGWALDGTPATIPSRPAGLHAVEVCAASGRLPSPEGDCPVVREWFIAGTEPAEVDTMVREAAIDRDTGRLATIFTPPQLIERRTYIVYPPEATVWAENAGIESLPTEYDTIRRVPTQQGGAAVLSPEPFAVVSGQWSVLGSAGGDDFAYYRLAYFHGLLPEAMQPLFERGETPVTGGELGVWDTTLLEDGLYTLLLTVVHGDQTFDEVAIPVTIANEPQ